jgi:hypothetical protein
MLILFEPDSDIHYAFENLHEWVFYYRSLMRNLEKDSADNYWNCYFLPPGDRTIAIRAEKISPAIIERAGGISDGEVECVNREVVGATNTLPAGLKLVMVLLRDNLLMSQ